MCGRAACTLNPRLYRQTVSKKLGSDLSNIQWLGQDSYKPSYNIAPTDNLPIVHKCLKIEELSQGETMFKTAFKLLESNIKKEFGEYIIHTMQWGIPVTIDSKFTKPIINARCETIKEKPMFRKLLKSNRCVVFIDGFYEWQKINSSKSKQVKSTYFICPKNGIKKEDVESEHEMLCLAGLWEARKVQKEDSENVEYYFTVVTLPASEEMGNIHDRMPAILTNPHDIEIWLGDGNDEDPVSVLRPPESNSLEFRKVTADSFL